MALAGFSKQPIASVAGPSHVILHKLSTVSSCFSSPLHVTRNVSSPEDHDIENEVVPFPLSSEQLCQLTDDAIDSSSAVAFKLHATSDQDEEKSKGYKRKLAGNVASSHLTIDSEHQCIRLAILGAPGVGKSAIVRQFVMQEFPEEYVPTEQKQIFCPAVIINDHLYELRIVDCPYIPYFPVSSLYEWTDFRGCGLRTATAYILVYDVTCDDSFQYIKNIREQILESRDMHDVPMFVVSNKQDLADREERGSQRELSNMIRKQWKCGYVECSAKYNWHIMQLFKELMKSVDGIDYGHKPTSSRVQDVFRHNRCIVL